MPAQEPGTRPHRPTVHQPFADVTVDRTTSQVTASFSVYGFSVYGPDGFLTSFAGEVVPVGLNTGQVPVVSAALGSAAAKTIELTLANEGQQAIRYTLAPNDYEGSTQTVTVQLGNPKTISWPTDQYGYYDVVITANTTGGFRRRYAGRVA
jgi:phospholipase C